MDLYSTMQQVGAQTFSSMTDMIVQWAETGKLNAQILQQRLFNL
jgi:phage-related minor tail protein